MTITSDITACIRKYSVKNATDYGKAHEGSVLNKVISEYPEHKQDIKAIAKEVGHIVAEVNSLAPEMLKAEYLKYAPEFDERETGKRLKTSAPNLELKGAVTGTFATRYPPAPNGYMHIGHAKSVFLGSEMAAKYSGKFFLYFDDTNPDKDKQEFVDQFHDVLNWLGIKFDDEYYASDSIEKTYSAAETLINNGNAYACSCSPEKIKADRLSRTGCEHRENDRAANLKSFKAMLSGSYEENSMIIRFRGDMKSENTALRDPIILRIKKTRHYRQGNKYCVWPTYDFNTPIMDSIHGVTDVLRSKEFELRDELGRQILHNLSMRQPRIHSFSRLVIKGNITHKRELNKLISEGLISGFDDPRLVTITALRRRGIRPEAIRNFILKVGMTKTDSIVSIDPLLAENRKVIEPESKHLFFVKDPVKLFIKGMKKSRVSLKLQPSSSSAVREYDVGETFYIAGHDAKQINEGDIIRLKDFICIKILSSGEEITAESSAAQGSESTIQWVSGDNYLKCKIMIPTPPIGDAGNFKTDSLTTANGYIENYAQNLAEHDIVQLERFGYCILDDKKSLGFIFISR